MKFLYCNFLKFLMDPKSDVGHRSRYLVLAPGFSLNKKTKTGHFALSNKIYHHSQFLSDNYVL